MMIKKLFLLPAAALIFTACGKENAAAPNYKPDVSLAESTAPEGCLSLPKYFEGVRAMDPARPVQEISTKIDTKSKYAIRANFKLLLAYGSTHAATKPLSEIPDFQNVSQEACARLTVTAPDGAAENLDIVSATKESLRAEDEDGYGFEFTWLAPTRMRITQRYRAYDLPCGTDTAITVIHTKELDWSGRAADAVVMDANLVRSIADTVGADPAEAAAEDGKVSLARVQELLSRDPRPELLTCNGQPAPVPGPAPSPTDPTPAPAPAPNDPAPSPTDPIPVPNDPAPQPNPENPNRGNEGPSPGPTNPAPNPTPNPDENHGGDSPWWWPWP